MTSRVATLLLASALSACLAAQQAELEPEGGLVLYVAAPARTELFGDGSRLRPFARIEHALEAVRRERRR